MLHVDICKILTYNRVEHFTCNIKIFLGSDKPESFPSKINQEDYPGFIKGAKFFNPKTKPSGTF